MVWCADDEFGGDDGEAVEEGLVAESCVYKCWDGAELGESVDGEDHFGGVGH